MYKMAHGAYKYLPGTIWKTKTKWIEILLNEGGRVVFKKQGEVIEKTNGQFRAYMNCAKPLLVVKNKNGYKLVNTYK